MDHILAASQFTRPDIEKILKHAGVMEVIAEKGGNNALRGKILATLFYEPSTRTRLSFETAMLRLGGNIISVADAKTSGSAAKGEILEDSIKVINKYVDVIALRHPEAGAAARAAAVSGVPLMNAGDGPGEHPTQSLLDLYTIQKELGTIDDIHIAFVGDLKHGRTVRSLARFLSNFRNVRITLVSPPSLALGNDIKEFLKEKGMQFSEAENLEDALSDTDILYMTRVQQERFTDTQEYMRVKDNYILTLAQVKKLKERARIMHPLPRVNEIAQEVDTDPRAAYFRQAQNGLYMRMALLDILCHSRDLSAEASAKAETGNPE